MPVVRTTKIKSISRGSNQHVYDIGVEKNHTFFANGHVVSNCFQEQFMLLSQQLAGFTPGESDAMRKTLVKKDLTSLGKKADEKVALENKFIEGCVNVSGFDRRKAKELFDKIAFFSLYGFNACLHGDSQVTTRHGKKKITDVVVGDEVLAPNGFVKVLKTYEQGVKQVYRIRTKSGKTLACTMDHKIMTNQGMMRLEDVISHNKKEGFFAKSQVQIKTKNNDAKKNAYLMNRGWHLIRIWTSDIDKNINNCFEQVIKYVG